MSGGHGELGVKLALAVALAVWTAGPVVALEISAYLAAASAGTAGEVAGRAYEERRRPDVADRPLEGTMVTLLPQPAPLASRLDDIRRGARSSDAAFRTAVSRMLQAVQDHESAVRALGGTHLILTGSAGPDGVFVFPGVPAGAWLVLARHEMPIPGNGGRIGRKDQQMYRIGPRLDGYRSIRLWLREIEVAAGRAETVEVHDRNVWFSGIVETRSGSGR